MKSQYDVVILGGGDPPLGSARGSRADFGGSPKCPPDTRLLMPGLAIPGGLARPPIMAREAACAPWSRHDHVSPIARRQLAIKKFGWRIITSSQKEALQ